jgi:hypothetical protein
MTQDPTPASTPLYYIKLLCLAYDGPSTSYDGRYLAAYDPTWNYDAPPNGLLIMKLETTQDPAAAMSFSSIDAAFACWQQICPNNPIRADGKPNRPLSAFTVEVIRCP